jgi:hypothetical protein
MSRPSQEPARWALTHARVIWVAGAPHPGRAGNKAHYHAPNYIKGVSYKLGFHRATIAHIIRKCPPPTHTSSMTPPGSRFTADPSTHVPPKNGAPAGHPSYHHRPTPSPQMRPPLGLAGPRNSTTVVGARLHSQPFHTCPSREWRISGPSQLPPPANTVTANASSSGTDLGP